MLLAGTGMLLLPLILLPLPLLPGMLQLFMLMLLMLQLLMLLLIRLGPYNCTALSSSGSQLMDIVIVNVYSSVSSLRYISIEATLFPVKRNGDPRGNYRL